VLVNVSRAWENFHIFGHLIIYLLDQNCCPKIVIEMYASSLHFMFILYCINNNCYMLCHVFFMFTSLPHGKLYISDYVAPKEINYSVYLFRKNSYIQCDCYSLNFQIIFVAPTQKYKLFQK